MKAKLPPGTRAEKVEFARRLMREQQAARSKVRLSRLKRRLLVADLYVVVLATVVWLTVVASNTVAGNQAIALLWFLLAVQAALFVALTYSVGDLTRPFGLDERERFLRDRATALAYRILAVAVAALSFAAIVADQGFHWLPHFNASMGVTPYLVPFIWFTASLPVAVLAWTLPDPDPEPDREP